MKRTWIILFALLPFTALADLEIDYSGTHHWDARQGILTFSSSGRMPQGKEEFFWDVPPSVRKIVIAENVTVQGGFRVRYRCSKNPLTIEGQDRATSIIYGTDETEWTRNHHIPDNQKWKYGAVSVLEDATVYIHNLTSQNPRGYHISGYANRSVIHVDCCSILDTRPGSTNNSDGFVGAAGSSIKNSSISTTDDAIKIYHDITIENVDIEQHRNGAPLQLGWGGTNRHAKAVIKNLTIKGVSPNHRYNMAPISWVAGNQSSRTLNIDGLVVDVQGELFLPEASRWTPIGLFYLQPETCVFTLKAANAAIRTSTYGIVNTTGEISFTPTKKE